MDSKPRTPAPQKISTDLPARVHRGILIVLQAIMAVELILVFYEQQWINAFLVMAIMAVTLSPALLGRRFRVHIPAEFQLLAVVFIFAALFLGEIHSYYVRFWWWDIALHTSSGLLMGILGFLLVYVLNESERVDVHMRAHFVALFAFLFAVTVGTLWEIFEFGMDQIVGTNMQKPMLGDLSGLTDTMWDMIVNALGALTISVLGWWYMKRDERSFIEAWIRKFIERNPRLFRH
ncbi:MAG: hypothetical protein OQL06_03360 [Gammaproteobacteria bacterium]|nr:hypothetical protein [Gammaproteobacteria bacterium]